MHRREFMAWLGSATIAGARVGRAQQPTMPTIGYLDSSAGTVAKLAAFYGGLKTEGFVKDQNVTIEYDAVEGDYDRLAALAAKTATSTFSATSTIPIVFAVAADPVQIGLVGSPDRPGGHMTGVTDMAAGRELKLLELLHELIPTAAVFALLVNPANPAAESQARDALAGARQMGLQVNVLYAKAEGDFDGVFAKVSEMRAGG